MNPRLAVRVLGVPGEAQFDAASALVNSMLGLAGRYGAAARLLAPDTDRTRFLREVARGWEQLDGQEFPFVRGMAAELDGHEDRAQFLAGVDLIVAGIRTAR